MANFQAVIRSVTDRSYRWTGGSTAAAAADSQGAGGWLAEASAVDVDGAAASADGTAPDGETMLDTLMSSSSRPRPTHRHTTMAGPEPKHHGDDGRAGDPGVPPPLAGLALRPEPVAPSQDLCEIGARPSQRILRVRRWPQSRARWEGQGPPIVITEVLGRVGLTGVRVLRGPAHMASI
ncbi:hypothetical protein THAOC_25821 [Thalassiosira oceanica]|uniref:Uncharacterized protein n=1 Tax=Thalassiosira oceanica TaxID=159749 RepID=K0S6P4_THAOC|nr:hypothetical protein THAOC_25821 [Thalassiosira oceanica]|eukprot:EJK54542.1 hypothetical protein THAOC_25821 [Thalassiosira oceanica]